MSAQIIAIDQGNVNERDERARLLSAALRGNGYKAVDTLRFREDHEWRILSKMFPPNEQGGYLPISPDVRTLTYTVMRAAEKRAQQCSEKPEGGAA